MQDTTFQSIMKCDVDVRKGLCSNVLLSGGITMVANIDKHVTNELIALAPTTDDLICFIEKKKKTCMTLNMSCVMVGVPALKVMMI